MNHREKENHVLQCFANNIVEQEDTFSDVGHPQLGHHPTSEWVANDELFRCLESGEQGPSRIGVVFLATCGKTAIRSLRRSRVSTRDRLTEM